jgi:group I intron endonuclease
MVNKKMSAVMIMGYIYKVSLKDDRTKAYIGQTRNDPQFRWRQHINDKIEDSYFHNALRLYGPDAFHWEVVIVCFDEDLDAYEQEYIEKYNTLRPNGYNLRAGGSGGGKGAPELGQKISAAKKGRPNGLLGRKWTEESKQKASESAKGKPKSEEH